MSGLTVVTFKWRNSNNWAARDYTGLHVDTLYMMLFENLNMPFRFICFTDDASDVKLAPTWHLWQDPVDNPRQKYPNCWRRLKLFDPHFNGQFGEWILCVDLDALIVNDMTQLVTIPMARKTPFTIAQGHVCPYNGSMWMIKTQMHGRMADVWYDFDPDTTPQFVRTLTWPDGRKYYGSDQAWLSHKLPDADTWTRNHKLWHFKPGIRNLKPFPFIPAEAEIIFFAGSTKPWHLEMEHQQRGCPQIHELYAAYRQQAIQARKQGGVLN